MLPANAAQDTARKEKQAARLRRRLRQIHAAEKARTDEMEALATTHASAKAIQAMRARHLERFTELETERETIETGLAALATLHAQIISPELLDALPLIPAILPELPELPARLRRKLYQAFDLNMIYKHDTSQVTIYATVTSTTRQTVDAIINDSHNPSPSTACSDSHGVPITRHLSHDHEASAGGGRGVTVPRDRDRDRDRGPGTGDRGGQAGVTSMPQVWDTLSPGSSISRSTPETTAFGGQVIGSMATAFRRCDGSSVSPVNTCIHS